MQNAIFEQDETVTVVNNNTKAEFKVDMEQAKELSKYDYIKVKDATLKQKKEIESNKLDKNTKKILGE